MRALAAIVAALALCLAAIPQVEAAPLYTSGPPIMTVIGSNVDYNASTGDLRYTGGSGEDWSVEGMYSANKGGGDKAIGATVNQNDTYFMIGFSDSQTIDYHSMNFVIYACSAVLCGAKIYKFESGSATEIGTFSAGDVLAVEFDGTSVLYKQNGSTISTSSGALTGATYITVAINNQHGTTSFDALTYDDSPGFTPTVTLTRTVTPTYTLTPTGTPLPTATPSGGVSGDNIMDGLTGCVVDGFTVTDFSDCLYTKNEQTNGSIAENCDPHGHIYWDLGAYYYVDQLAVYFEGTNHGAGGDLQWVYWDVNLGWQAIDGAYSPQLTDDAWTGGSGSGTPPIRYIGIQDLNYSAYYWCPNEVEATGDSTSAPPTWTATPLGTATLTGTQTNTPGPTLTPTLTPTPTSTTEPCPDGFFRVGGFCVTPTAGPTNTVGAGTPTLTPIPPTPTTPPTGSCGPHAKHLYYPASLGHDTTVTVHNAGCIFIIGSTASHSGSFHCNLSCGAFRDGPFFGRGTDSTFYQYNLACVVSIHDLSPLQGACADVEIVTRLNDLDVYWSDPQQDSPRTSTPSPTPGPGTPTVTPGSGETPTTGPQGYPTQACGLNGQDPCIVAQATPFPTVTCGQVNQPPCNVIILLPTLIPGFNLTPVIPTAVAGTAVVSGTFDYLPDAYQATGDTYTAGFNGTVYDMGCPFVIDGHSVAILMPEQVRDQIDGIEGAVDVRVCVHYQYLEVIRILGVDIPIGPVFMVFLVCLIIGYYLHRG